MEGSKTRRCLHGFIFSRSSTDCDRNTCFERIFDLLKLGRQASSQRGVSVGGSKTGRCLCVFIGQRFELNVDRNLNVEGSAEKLVALTFRDLRAKTQTCEVMCHCTSQEQIHGSIAGHDAQQRAVSRNLVHCWAACPVTGCTLPATRMRYWA